MVREYFMGIKKLIDLVIILIVINQRMQLGLCDKNLFWIKKNKQEPHVIVKAKH